MRKLLIYLFLASMNLGCTNGNQKLPILGNPVTVNGKQTYPSIKQFSFINQDSLTVTNENFDNKVYVTDFMFLSCPTICPKMTVEMKRVYDLFENNPNVLFLSHTIDPKNDTVEKLKEYAEGIAVKSTKWHFVTGNRDSIYTIAKDSYFATAYPDETAPGGYVHSGGLLLIDKDKLMMVLILKKRQDLLMI